jgi:hypothetical protein
VPKQIIVCGYEYKWDTRQNYYSKMSYEDGLCDDLLKLSENYPTLKMLNLEVETIEEQEDIDIQAIEELRKVTVQSETYQSVYDNREKINELIQAIKQLDRKINKE